MRLVCATALPVLRSSRATRERRMFGLLSTLQVGTGSQLVPVACPIALLPLDQVDDPRFGLIAPGEVAHGTYGDMLGQALSSDFCRWYG